MMTPVNTLKEKNIEFNKKLSEKTLDMHTVKTNRVNALRDFDASVSRLQGEIDNLEASIDTHTTLIARIESELKT